MNKQFKASVFVKYLADTANIIGNQDVIISNVSPIFTADKNSISFVSHERHDKIVLARDSKAGVLLVDEYSVLNIKPQLEQLFIIVENPRLAFMRIVEFYFREEKAPIIHPNSTIDPEAIIGNNVYIGPGVVLGKVVLGDNSIIHGNCFVFDNVAIGKNVVIWPGCVIGGDGFGYVRDENNYPKNFPHIGGVCIEDFVHIGANVCIDRGSIGNTVIRKHVKIDNLVHIAHNCIIGESSYVIANTMIGGSAEIGDNCWIAPNSAIRDAIKIGHNTVVGMGAIVVKSIAENETVAGNPARSMRDFKLINSYLSDISK